MATCRKILIAGFSGSGKSSLLKAIQPLAPVDWEDFQDLDDLVLQKHSDTGNLADLIGREGWEKFRYLERQELENWLKLEGKGVLSLGGGSLTSSALEILRPRNEVLLVHLHCDFETCWKRLMGEVEQPRPLTRRGKDELRKIFRERQKDYEKSHLRLNNPDGADLTELSRSFWEKVLSSESC